MNRRAAAAQTATRDRVAERGHVIWASVSNVSLPLAPSLKKRYRLIADYAPHSVIAYHSGRRFRHVSEDAEFYLAPRGLPFILRVPLFALWLWAVTAYLVLFRGARVLVSQSPYEGFLLWLVRVPLRLIHRRLVLVVQVQGFTEEVLPLVHSFLSWMPFLWKGALRLAIRRADVVRAISAATEEHVRAQGARQVFVYPTWSNWELFLEPPAGDPRPTSDIHSLLFVGTLTSVKGVDLLLDAVALLKKRGRSVELSVVGNGPEEEALKDQTRRLELGDAVHWMGRVPLEQVKELMDDCFATVIPSRSEGLSRVALEAGACGKPVVATSVGGLPDAVQDGRTGLLVPPEDPDALARAVEYLIENHQEAKALGERGREAVESSVGTKAWMEGYSAMLEAAWAKLHRA